MIKITSTRLDALREALALQMSSKRYKHTIAVEEMAVRLSALYCPEKTMEIRVAALLHDLTKEKNPTEQLTLCGELGLEVDACQILSPKTYHARTAAALIPVLYPDLASEEVVSAVRWHTTGRAGMTIGESVIYLADYIDLSRTFLNCVKLRDYFWNADPESMTPAQRLTHLYKTLIISFDMTIADLIDEMSPIAQDTVQARNDLLCRIADLV